MASKPIGSVYGIHANMTGVQYIDGTVNVSIYSSTMDPMAECYSASIWAKKKGPHCELTGMMLRLQGIIPK